MKNHLNRIEDLMSLCPEIHDILVGNEIPGRSGKTQRSRGQSTTNNLLIIANLILDKRIRDSLETGMAYGASTLAILATKKYAGICGKHISIDPFQQLHFDDCGVVAVERANLVAGMEVSRTPSSIELPRLLDSGASFDLIYVDGSHLFEDAFVDSYFGIRLLRKGGIILFDDSADKHVAKVLRFIRFNLHTCLHELDLSQWRGDHGRNWRYHLGKMLGRVQLTGYQKTNDVQREYGTQLVKF
jgi:hypothetical protein